MCFFIDTTVILQIGVPDNCWCRSKVMSRGRHAIVDLAPISDDQWEKLWKLWVLAPVLGLVATWLLFVFVEFSDAQDLCKSHAEKHQELLTIADLGEKLQKEGQLASAFQGE
jgi:hypothetical protein